jgi:hypothetical protein
MKVKEDFAVREPKRKSSIILKGLRTGLEYANPTMLDSRMDGTLLLAVRIIVKLPPRLNLGVDFTFAW